MIMAQRTGISNQAPLGLRLLADHLPLYFFSHYQTLDFQLWGKMAEVKCLADTVKEHIKSIA